MNQFRPAIGAACFLLPIALRLGVMCRPVTLGKGVALEVEGDVFTLYSGKDKMHMRQWSVSPSCFTVDWELTTKELVDAEADAERGGGF